MAVVGADALSAREAEVLAALGEHHTNAEIGRLLHISIRTVESHVSSLLRKLDAADRRELAARAPAIIGGADSGPNHSGAGEALRELPATWTTFIGRDAERAAVADALSTNRLVTLLGPGGVGKTRLAVEVARQVSGSFPAGGAFVDLVPVGSEFITNAVAAALDVDEQAQQPLLEVVQGRLRQAPALLVLDNCEHLIAGVAAFVQACLTACPELVVLATSRERLGVVGERVLALGPLTGESEAERLFLDRAAGALGPPVDRQQVAEICRRLDGMPLAIELAAARVGSIGIDGLVAGLDDHLRLLGRSPTSAGHDRHGSLRTVLEWSHNLLDDEERTMFRRLGVFAGPFDLAAVIAVAADGESAAASDLLGRLTDKSLLVHGPHSQGSRWRMLETVLAYAREQLDASGERPAIERRHRDWAMDEAGRIEGLLADDRIWQEVFDHVDDDLRAALALAAADHDPCAFDLAMALGHLTYARRFRVEARDHYATAIAQAPDGAAQVRALHAAAAVAIAELRGEVYFDLLMKAFEVASAMGDMASAAIALASAAAIAGRDPKTFASPVSQPERRALVEQARSIAPAGDARVAVHLALSEAWAGGANPWAPDAGAVERAFAQAQQLDDPVLLSEALDGITATAMDEGRLKDAARVTRQRLDLLARLPRHDPRSGGEIADIYHMAVETALAAGQLENALAAAMAERADVIGQSLAHFAATHLVVPLTLRGAFDEALAEAAVMREGWVRAGQPTAGWMASSFLAVSLIHGLRGDSEAHQDWHRLAEQVAPPSPRHLSRLFVDIRLALHLGDLERAAAIAEREAAPPGTTYYPYAMSQVVEAAAATGRVDAARLLAAAEPLAAQNDFAAPVLARARGRLSGDPDAFAAAVAGFEAIGARFERAATLLLLPERADEGREELRTLGC